jgi:hypothetical protein
VLDALGLDGAQAVAGRAEAAPGCVALVGLQPVELELERRGTSDVYLECLVTWAFQARLLYERTLLLAALEHHSSWRGQAHNSELLSSHNLLRQEAP